MRSSGGLAAGRAASAVPGAVPRTACRLTVNNPAGFNSLRLPVRRRPRFHVMYFVGEVSP